jgi:hypothetical protein
MTIQYCPYTNTSPPLCNVLSKKIAEFCEEVEKLGIRDSKLKKLVEELCRGFPKQYEKE